MVPLHLTISCIAQLPYSRSITGRLNGDSLQPSAYPGVIDCKGMVTGPKHCAARYVHGMYFVYLR